MDFQETVMPDGEEFQPEEQLEEAGVNHTRGTGRS
jgi:hypothetical protein